MVSFKDVVAQDVSLFLNEEEFADKLVIDGREVTAVLDQTTNDKHPLAYAEGVSLITHVLYVQESELEYIPDQDQRLVINGSGYFARRISEEMGMLVINLEANG